MKWRRNKPVDLRTFTIRAVLDKWVARSRWWSGDEKRVYFRLHTSRGIVEVYRSNRKWFISRTAD